MQHSGSLQHRSTSICEGFGQTLQSYFLGVGANMRRTRHNWKQKKPVLLAGILENYFSPAQETQDRQPGLEWAVRSCRGAAVLQRHLTGSWRFSTPSNFVCTLKHCSDTWGLSHICGAWRLPPFSCMRCLISDISDRYDQVINLRNMMQGRGGNTQLQVPHARLLASQSPIPAHWGHQAELSLPVPIPKNHLLCISFTSLQRHIHAAYPQIPLTISSPTLHSP